MHFEAGARIKAGRERGDREWLRTWHGFSNLREGNLKYRVPNLRGVSTMNTVDESLAVYQRDQQREVQSYELPVNVKTAARFLGVSPSLVYAYVERRQIPHFRIMGRAIRFSLSELEKWRRQFFVNGGIDG
jgi:excisionase family DNA binding protein